MNLTPEPRTTARLRAAGDKQLGNTIAPCSEGVVPIPSTKRVKWLEQNVAALDIELSADDLAALDALAAKVVGARY